jgi:hypothetical protein
VLEWALRPCNRTDKFDRFGRACYGIVGRVLGPCIKRYKFHRDCKCRVFGGGMFFHPRVIKGLI